MNSLEGRWMSMYVNSLGWVKVKELGVYRTDGDVGHDCVISLCLFNAYMVKIGWREWRLLPDLMYVDDQLKENLSDDSSVC